MNMLLSVSIKNRAGAQNIISYLILLFNGFQVCFTPVLPRQEIDVKCGFLKVVTFHWIGAPLWWAGDRSSNYFRGNVIDAWFDAPVVGGGLACLGVIFEITSHDEFVGTTHAQIGECHFHLQIIVIVM